MKIIGELPTTFYGDALIGEYSDGTLTPVGKSEENAINWHETKDLVKYLVPESNISNALNGLGLLTRALFNQANNERPISDLKQEDLQEFAMKEIKRISTWLAQHEHFFKVTNQYTENSELKEYKEFYQREENIMNILEKYVVVCEFLDKNNSPYVKMDEIKQLLT